MSVERKVKSTYNTRIVEQVARKLGMTITHNARPKMYGKRNGKADEVCDIVVNGVVGFKKDGASVTVIYDDMYARNTLAKLLPEYVKTTVGASFEVTKTVQKNNKLTLVLRRR